jgi:hypothetical protein
MPATQAAALLRYRIQPDRVFIGTTTRLTLEIRNDTASAVTFGEGDAVEVTFPAGEGADALSRVVNYEAGAHPDEFTAGRVEGSTGTYRVRASGFEPRELLPGRSVLVTFDGVVVNGVPSDNVVVAVLEQLEEKAPSSVTMAKIPRELNVVAWLEDLVVGLGQQTTLHWQSFGGTRVVVAAFEDGSSDPNCPAGDRQPGYRCFPVSGDPPYPGSVEVGVPDPEQPEKTYTVRVLTPTAQHREARVTLTQHRAGITGFGAGPGMVRPTQPIGAMDQVPLLWTSVYGRRAELRTPTDSAGRRVSLNPATPLVVTPGRDAWLAAGDRSRIPATAEYVLRVSGFREPAEARLVYQLRPVRVLFFKYAKRVGDTLSDPVYEVDPRGWGAVEMMDSPPRPRTLTVYGPGGTKEVLYLGAGDTVHPQVQYFAATAGEGGKKTLHWVTANLTALRLEPVGYDVPAGQIANGSYEVAPSRTTDYVLRATAPGGEITSTLRVPVP